MPIILLIIAGNMYILIFKNPTQDLYHSKTSLKFRKIHYFFRYILAHFIHESKPTDILKQFVNMKNMRWYQQ